MPGGKLVCDVAVQKIVAAQQPCPPRAGLASQPSVERLMHVSLPVSEAASLAGMASLTTAPARLLALAADVLMPPVCASCKAAVDSQGYCAICWSRLGAISGTRCDRCSTPLPIAWQTEATCLDCLRAPPDWDRAIAPYLYTGAARETLLAFKNGREELGRLMGQAMARAGKPLFAPKPLLIPVPLHRWRLWSRGYNQSVLLARDVAARTGLETRADLLLRAKATRKSNGLSRAGRIRNVRGVFQVPPAVRPLLKGRHVVLVDDVLTSGATASACARVLRRAGAARVDVLVYARVAQADVPTYLVPVSRRDDDGQS